MRILVAEDERFLADLVAEGLREQAMAVDVAYDGAAALERLAVNDYDVLVLDRDLPRVHGDEVCRELAQRGETVRILMLTASGAVHERVTGLNLGADDHLAKPFAFDELVARIRALARRGGDPLPPVLERGGITLDAAHRQAHRDGRYLPLSRKEYAVLEVLMQARGRVVSTEEILVSTAAVQGLSAVAARHPRRPRAAPARAWRCSRARAAAGSRPARSLPRAGS